MPSYLPDLNEIQFTAVASRGPGGQNVNKVSSAAQLTWDYRASLSLSEAQKRQITKKLARYINKNGLFRLRSDEYRDLERNKQRCLEKLDRLLEKAYKRPKPRKKTRPSKASKEKRVDEKKQRGEKKRNRQKVDF